MKYWCTTNKKQFEADHYDLLTKKHCPDCWGKDCDWGPIAEATEEQKEQAKKIVFDAVVPGITPGTTFKMDYSTPPSKYHIPVVGIDTQTGEARKVMIDVYAVQYALHQTPQVAHSFKKLWAAGKRNGGKSYKQDIEESRKQLEMELNRIELEERLNG